MGHESSSPCCAAVGRALCDLRAGDPARLAHHGAGVRQAANVLHRHHQVPRRLEDLHGLVMGDAEEAAAVHLQDLVAHLRRGEGRERRGGGRG